LTYRVLAALTAIGTKTINPIFVGQGYIDSSGYGGGPNGLLDRFVLPGEVARPREDDPFGQPGYRFWLPVRGEEPLMVIEQSTATAWFLDSSDSIDLRASYISNAKEPALVAAELLRRALAGGDLADN
jgi:hypothetical protein